MIDEDTISLLNRAKQVLMEARLSKYEHTTDLFDLEVAIENYLDLEDALFEGYTNLDKIWR